MRIFRNRARGLPRERPSPEPNTIQNPRVTRGIQQFLGMRQAHVAPGLTEGVNPSLVVGDIREDPRTMYPESFASFLEVIPDGVNVKRATFYNPYNNDRVCVLRRYHFYLAEDMIGVLPANSIVYDLQPPGAFVMEPLNRGYRLVTGYQAVSLAPPQPLSGLDGITFPNPRRSLAGWKTTPIDGIAGGYIWRGVISGTLHGQSGVWGELIENFEHLHGPRMIVYPGGIFEVYVLDTNVHAYHNMWWDEYPLT